MSLVKKLLPGGSIDNESLNNELNSELATYKLPSKKERLVRDKLVELRNYFDQEGNTYSVDALAKKYTISGTGSEKYQGSPDEIARNPFTGGLRIKDDGDVNSIAMAIYEAAHKRAVGSTVTKTKESLGISDLNNYVIDQVYGTEDAFDADFHSIKSDDERKKKVFEFANNFATDYLTQAEKNKDDADYTDIDKVKAVQAAIATGDWEKFKNAAYKLKWNPNGFLVSDSEKERYNTEELKQKAITDKKIAEDNFTANKNNLIKVGFSDSLATQLSTLGYKLGTSLKTPSTLNPNVSTFASDYITEKGGFIFDTPNGQSILDKNAKFVNESGENFNRFSPLYGLAWTNNDDGTISYNPSSYKPEDWGNVGIELKGHIPSFEDYSIQGFSDSEETPAEGRDYTKHLVLTKGNEKIELFKDENGIYRSKNGQDYRGISLSGYGNINPQEEFDATKDFVKFYDPSIKLSSDYNYLNDYNVVHSSLKWGHGNQSKKAVANLVTALAEGKFDSKPSTKNAIIELISQYDAKVNPVNQTTDQESILPLKGIIKAQSGTAFKAYKERQKLQTTPVNKPNTPKKVIGDITGSFADQSAFENTMDVASTAGAIASFVPVLGVAGGVTMTAADIVKDIGKDGFQMSDIVNWNTAANIGFTLLSGIGLGGLKTMLKVGKLVNKGDDIIKIAGKAEKIAQNSLNPTEKEALGKLVELSEKLGTKNTAELIGKASGTDKEILTKGLEVLKTIKNSSIPVLGSQTLGIATKNLSNVPNYLSKAASSKVIRYGTRAAVIAPAVPAAFNTAATVYNDGWKYTKPKDFKDIAMGLSMGKLWNRDFKAMRAVKRQATLGGTSDETFIILNGEKVAIPSELKIPANKKSLAQKYSPWGKEKVEKAHSENFEKFKSELKNSLESKGISLSEKQLLDLQKIKSSDIKFSKGQVDGVYTLEPFAKNVTGNRAIDIRDYELAKKYLGYNSIKKVEEVAKSEVKKAVKSTKTKVKKKIFALPEHKEPIISPKRMVQLNSSKYSDKSTQLINMQQNSDGTFYMNPKESIQLPPFDRKFITTGKIKSVPKTKNISKSKKSTVKTRKKVTKKQEGGILKFQKPFSAFPKYLSTHSNTLNSLGIDYVKGLALKENNSFVVAPQGRTSGKYYGGVTNELIAKNWDPRIIKGAGLDVNNWQKWGSDTPDRLQKYVKTIPRLYNQLKDKTSSSSGLFGMDWYTIGLKPDNISRLTSFPGQVKAIPAGTIKPLISTTKPGDISGTVPKKTPFDWKTLGINPANLAMFLNTMAANTNIGMNQRMAISHGLFQKPYMPQTYLRIDKPHSLFANKQAGNIRSSASRIAKGIVDIDKANAVNLQGEKQAGDLKIQGQQADLSRADQLRGQQLQMRGKIDEYNTNVLGENRGRAADAFSKTYLVNANETLAQNTAVNNYITAADRDFKVGRYRADMNKTWDMMNNPDLKKVSKEYSDLIGQEEYDRRKSEFDTYKESHPGTTGLGTFEESQAYRNYQNEIKRKRENLELLYNPVRERQQQMQYFAPLQFNKKGGTISLTKKERIEIDNNKADNVRRLRSTELAYKSIMHNNEMLQRSLIKIFK